MTFKTFKRTGAHGYLSPVGLRYWWYSKKNWFLGVKTGKGLSTEVFIFSSPFTGKNYTGRNTFLKRKPIVIKHGGWFIYKTEKTRVKWRENSNPNRCIERNLLLYTRLHYVQ